MVLVEFGNAIKSSLKMGCGADSTGRNAKSAYRIAKGEISGCINLAVWHAVGHTVFFRHFRSIFERSYIRFL